MRVRILTRPSSAPSTAPARSTIDHRPSTVDHRPTIDAPAHERDPVGPVDELGTIDAPALSSLTRRAWWREVRGKVTTRQGPTIGAHRRGSAHRQSLTVGA